MVLIHAPIALALAGAALVCLASLPEDLLMTGPLPPPDVPPSPLAEPAPSDPVADVALPWTTPIATALAALAGQLSVVAQSVYFGYLQPAMLPGMGLPIVDDVLASALRGLGAAVADRVRPLWPRWARWAVGIALASAVPGPLDVKTAIAGGLAPAMEAMCRHIVWGAVIGLVFGLVARGRRGLLWKLSLAGSAVGLGWSAVSGVLGVTVDSVRLGHMTFLGMSLVTLVLVCFAPAATGFAFGKRLTAARLKAERGR